MYKLEFTLKQHTPLIHFQHNQDGATLRASEVKPKLDRFLIGKLQLTKRVQKDGKEVEVSKSEYKSWFNSEDHLSLDYKLKIEPNQNKKEDILKGHKNSPMYFANMGSKPEDIAKYKHFKFTEGEISCSIFSFNMEKVKNITLLDVIEDNIYSFFFQNNFGTRQSKGYGSFEVDTINKNKLQSSQKKRECNYLIQLTNVENYKTAFEQVSYFYKSLRSGINLIDKQNYKNPLNRNDKYYLDLETTSKYYIKPLIFLYAKSLNQQWDKKTIKQTYLNSDLSRKFNNSGNEKQAFVEKFRLTTQNFNDNRRNLYVKEIGLQNQTIKHENSEILTFSSNAETNKCYYDYKDVFGLSAEESWKSYEKVFIKENVRKNSKSNFILNKNNKDNDFIDRFKSPLLFKLIKENKSYNVYIIFNDLPKEYVGSKFNVHPKHENSSLVLEIPEFKLQDFFNYISDHSKFDYKTYLPVLKYNNYNQHEKAKFEEPEKINSALETFFSQIQNQSNNVKQ